MEEKFPALFKGPRTATVTWAKVIDGDLYILERNKLIPALNKWKHKAGHIKDRLSLYESRKIFDPHTGKRDGEMRIFYFGLDDYQEDHSTLNIDLLRELESKRQECSYLYAVVQDLKAMLEVAGMHDLVKQRMIDEHKMIKDLGPPGFAVPYEKAKKKK